jgi:hypothetical protein
MGDIVSAMQKFIRRGMAYEAARCAAELMPYYQKYVWRRLKIIALEDVGDMAVFLAIKQLDETRQECDELQHLCLMSAILWLCRAVKSREADNLATLVQHGHMEEEPLNLEPFESFVYDKHTARGRQEKRGWQHFREVGTVVEPARENEFAEAAWAILLDGRTHPWQAWCERSRNDGNVPLAAQHRLPRPSREGYEPEAVRQAGLFDDDE